MAGRIMTRMTTDVDALSNLLQTGLINALVALFTFVGVGVALVVWNWKLGLVTLSVLVPLVVATVVYRRLSGRAYRRARERIAVVNANMPESLSGVRESQAFVREDRNEADFRTPGGPLPRRPARGPAAGGPVLPVRRDAVRRGRRRGARASDRCSSPSGSLTAGELVGLPALPRPVLRAHPAAVPDLRLLPAGRGVDAPDQRADGHPAAGRRRRPNARRPRAAQRVGCASRAVRFGYPAAGREEALRGR